MTNYRGITITSIVDKVIEHIFFILEAGQLERNSSNMQFGFSYRMYPFMALTRRAVGHDRDHKVDLWSCVLSPPQWGGGTSILENGGALRLY